MILEFCSNGRKDYDFVPTKETMKRHPFLEQNGVPFFQRLTKVNQLFQHQKQIRKKQLQ
jgi:hypothetical protein